MKLTSYNPATGEPVGQVPITPVDQIPQIVARSRAAQEAWADLAIEKRIEMILPAGKLLQQRAETVGRQLTLEMGKPIGSGIGEVRGTGMGWAEEAEEIRHSLAPAVLEDETVTSTIYRDPYGVCVCITPWNFPISMPHWLVFPALIAGNSVILKPSEETPLTGQAYADALMEVLPKDVLQIVHGDGAQGAALVKADVDLITFTGSLATGKKILVEAADSMKRVLLELGGKDPLIVLDDADIEAAARFAAANSFRNSGQVCVSTERIYVHEKIEKSFVDALIRETKQMAVGDPTAQETAIGPMINERQRSHVLAQIDRAVAQGATIAHGGEGHSGNYVVPTVLTGVTHDMDIAIDETFGPVAAVVRVRDDDEAVRLANDSPYGLGAVVYGDQQRAKAVARRLKSGMIGVNKGIGGAQGMPWVGAKQSGYGFHSGPEGHRQFTQIRVVSTTNG